jgi:outer membrane receptor protein involved in Fe transport
MAGDAPAQANVPAVEFSHLGHVFMAAVQYLAGETGTVALSFEQGFRAPNLTEAVQLGDSGRYFHIPNDELGPEQSNTFELLGRVHHGPFEWSWAGFVSLLDSLIKRVPTSYQGQTEIDGKTVVHNVNADHGLLWGMEAGLGVDLGAGFSVRSQASYAHGTEYREQDGEAAPMTRIPPLFGQATIRYDALLPGRWHAFLESTLRWALEQDRLSPEDQTDARIPEGGTPGWQTVNLRAGLSAAEESRLVVTIENLLDAEYKYHGSGVYGAGTNAVVSYEAGF